MTSTENLGKVNAANLNAAHLRHVVRIETGPANASSVRSGVLQGFLTEIRHTLKGDGHPKITLTVHLQPEANVEVSIDGHHPVQFVPDA